MDKYQNLNTININKFNNIFGCFEDICVFSMGCLFPTCLFGRTYEISGFGKCFTGCCKIFSLQFILSTFFSLIIFSMEWNMFLSDVFKYDKKLLDCNNNSTCHNDYDNINFTSISDNNCIVTNNTDMCDCLKQLIMDKCNYENKLPSIINNFIVYMFILNMINIKIFLSMNGVFYGHYRNKISSKYNILNNSRNNYYIHCIPCVHQLALCQEYNTIKRIELIEKPIYAINTKYNL